MTSPLTLEVFERLNTILDRMIRQSERLDAVISEMEKRVELRESDKETST